VRLKKKHSRKELKIKKQARSSFYMDLPALRRKRMYHFMHGKGKQISKSCVDETFTIYKPSYQLSISPEVDFGKKVYLTYSYPNANTPSEFFYEIQHNYRTLTPHLCVFYTNYIRYSIADTSFTLYQILLQ
jgi:hypothetical protein